MPNENTDIIRKIRIRKSGDWGAVILWWSSGSGILIKVLVIILYLHELVLKTCFRLVKSSSPKRSSSEEVYSILLLVQHRQEDRKRLSVARTGRRIE